MPSDRELEAAARELYHFESDETRLPDDWDDEPEHVRSYHRKRARAALSAAATARPDCREVVAELVAALDAFCRMPDAGLTEDDPRYQWWYETAEVRKRAREAVSEQRMTTDDPAFLKHEAAFWEDRYKTQHRTVHALEDKLSELRAEAERAENEWSAYTVTLNQRLERLEALARRRGIDDVAISEALSSVPDGEGQ